MSQLLPRYRREPEPELPSDRPVHSSSGARTPDPTDREMIGRLPAFGLDGAIYGTDPEAELMRKAENEGWSEA